MLQKYPFSRRILIEYLCYKICTATTWKKAAISKRKRMDFSFKKWRKRSADWTRGWEEGEMGERVKERVGSGLVKISWPVWKPFSKTICLICYHNCNSHWKCLINCHYVFNKLWNKLEMRRSLKNFHFKLLWITNIWPCRSKVIY